MYKLLLTSCATALLSTTALAQTPDQAPASITTAARPSNLFQAQDLFGLEVAADPQISPDGQTIVYVRQTADIMTDRMRSSLWQIDVRSGAHTPLITGPGGHSGAQWSPDGKRLAYISSSEGGSSQLFVRWMDSGQSVRITSLPNTPSGISWSPDGKLIAYSLHVAGKPASLGKGLTKPEGAQWAAPLEVIDSLTYRSDGRGYLKPGFSQIFVIASDGGGARQLTDGDFHHGGQLSWSKDSAQLFFSANRHPDWTANPNNSEIFALDLASGQRPAYSPD